MLSAYRYIHINTFKWNWIYKSVSPGDLAYQATLCLLDISNAWHKTKKILNWFLRALKGICTCPFTWVDPYSICQFGGICIKLLSSMSSFPPHQLRNGNTRQQLIGFSLITIIDLCLRAGSSSKRLKFYIYQNKKCKCLYLAQQLIHKHINIDHWNYPKPSWIISDLLFCLFKTATS